MAEEHYEGPKPNTFSIDRPLPDGMPFEPDSAMYRYNEPPGMLLIPFIAGLTVMHPTVAAGVEAHSSFGEQPLRRALATADAAVRLIYGNEEELKSLADRIHSFHKHIGGSHPEKDGQEYHGATYSANDGDAQMWVLASLFEGIKKTHERWLTPLDAGQEGEVWSDLHTFGLFFGVPKEAMPDNVEEFNSYWEEMIEGNLLCSTESSREIPRRVFRFRGNQALLPLGLGIQALSVTSLDPRLGQKVDIRPSPLDQALAKSFDLIMRNTYRHLPKERRLPLVAYLAARRRVVPAIGQLLSSTSTTPLV